MMTQEKKAQAIDDLRQWMEEVDDDEVAGRMRTALKRIRGWDPAGGEPMPYAKEVEEWRTRKGSWGKADEPGDAEPEARGWLAAAVDDAAADLAAAAPSSPVVAPPQAADPDDHLQAAFDRATAELNGGANYAAQTAFREILEQAAGRLRRPAQEGLYAAEAALKREKAPLLAAARAASPGTAEAAWKRVEAIDPDDADAREALDNLRAQARAASARARIDGILEEAETAVKERRLPPLNALLGEAEALRGANTTPGLRLRLDDVVREVTQRRDALRARLGSPSTLIATGNNKEAYRQARQNLDDKVPTIYDTAGIMGGEAGAEVETYAFMRKAREIYLNGLRNIAKDRQDVAKGEQAADPAAALATLQEAEAELTDELLTNDDRDELKVVLEEVQKARGAVERRLNTFREAQQLVVEAGAPGLPADEKYKTLRRAKEVYPEYPGIDELTRAAQSAVAAAAAAELEGAIARAYEAMEADKFGEALTILDEARRTATTKAPEQEPGSPLALRLEEVRKLENETIPAAKGRYDRMLEKVGAVDGLLDAYVAEGQKDTLDKARRHLEELAAAGWERLFIDERRHRLAGLVDVGTNWEQGRRSYDHGQWKLAVEQLSPVAAATNHQQKETAAQMVKRAEAALDVLAAETAEKGSRYEDARARYDAALKQFAAHGADERTEGARLKAEAALKRMKPYEDGDGRVSEKVKAAKLHLTQAEAATIARIGSSSLLKPNPGYAAAIKELEEAAGEPFTTLALNVERDLQEVKDKWEAAYSTAMLGARTAGDLEALRQGIARGEELERNKLLTKPENRELLRGLRVDALDLEYKRLIKDSTSAPRDIEDNRRARLEHTPEGAAGRAGVEAELAKAIADRVIAVMGDKREAAGGGDATAALAYLSHEMMRPEVYGSKELFEELMKLFWEEERWKEAHNEADKLRYRQLAQPQELAQLWNDLTDAAELMARNNFDGYKAKMDALSEWFPAAGGASRTADGRVGRRAPVWFSDAADRKKYLSDQDTALKTARVNKLIRWADEARIAGNRLKAAQYYAYASHWAPSRHEVVTGLQQVGQQLNADLDTKLEEAGKIVLGTGSLAGSLATAREIHQQLVDVAGVSSELRLPAPYPDDLAAAAARLKTRLDGWQRVELILKGIEADKEKALGNPSDVRPDGGGGWELEAVVQRFSEASDEAKKQAIDNTNLSTFINAEKRMAQGLAADAATLNAKVRAFLRAVDQEGVLAEGADKEGFDKGVYDKTGFDLIVAMANDLEREWSEREKAGFKGLKNLIERQVYRGARWLSTPDEHRQAAQQQKDDLKQWTEWATKAVKAHQTLAEAVEMLAQPLEELRGDTALVDLKAACENALKLMVEFQKIDGARPTGNPQSRAAEAQRDRVPDEWGADLTNQEQGTRRYVIDLQKQIEEDIAKLAGEPGKPGPLKMLNDAVAQLERTHAAIQSGKTGGRWGRKKTRTLSATHFSNADTYLKECRKLDPSNKDVIRAKNKLRELKTHYGMSADAS